MNNTQTEPGHDLEARVRRAIRLWSTGSVVLTGIPAGLALAAIWPGPVDPVAAVAVSAAWLVLSAIAGQVATWGLGGLLSRPMKALVTLGEMESAGPAVLPNDLRRAFGVLSEAQVRTAHERNGRISELARALEVAREENEARAGFFAGMSHELRTPLNAIIGYAMLLAEDAAEAGDTPNARDLDRILQSGRHLLRLINDILDLSRMDAGDLVLERGTIEVAGLLETVADSVQDEASRSNVRLGVAAAPGIHVMLGDGVRLKQCLSALLGRAVQANPGREVVFRTLRVDLPEGRIQFQITDDSGRLADSVIKAAAAEGASPAAGLAMDANALAVAVARRLCTLMGGTLEAGVGAGGAGILMVNMPLSPATTVEGGQTAPELARRPVELTVNKSGATPRLVLVIDDDEPTVDLLRRWMTQQGYAVISASSGEQGLALARSRRPDLIVLDIFMPGQSGYEVLAAMKADEVLRTIPVIVASSDDNRRLGLEAGAAEVMVKPLSRDRLRKVLDITGQQVAGDILVVDDDPDLRDLVRRFASQAGIEVRLAATGAEGLASARDRKPGAIVLDLCMPHTDGFSVMQALADDAELKSVPVMVLSQLEISAHQHAIIRDAGHVFHPKAKSSPLQIVQNIKTMVAK